MGRKIEDLIAEESRVAEEAEKHADPNEPLPPGTKLTRGHGRSKVLQVRLNDDEFAMVEKLAAEQHVPASTMARSVLLKALAG